ncbi:MAG: DNA topoisomerase I, partial [Candidatus Micrarchaeota archaeon]|nr:DNA topoisomerase I [Candidatus Micrarchaeota archaeon]
EGGTSGLGGQDEEKMMLKLVIPKGSLEATTLDILDDADLTVRRSGDREYHAQIEDPRIEQVRILRPQEIPKYVEDGFFDMGITGYDWIRESGADVVELADLPYTKTAVGTIVRLVLAVAGTCPYTRPEELPDGLRVSTEYPNIVREYFEKLGKNADELINSCDFDLEGSLIGYNVMRFACKKETGTRMKFSALTPDELVEAYEQRGELDFGNVEAAEARHVLDWFYGINLSRALMQAIRKKGEKRVMSIGRVQGPALSILSRREREIANFKPVPYWEVSVKCKKVKFLNTRGRFENEKEAREAERRTKIEGFVSKVERTEFPQRPEPPFDLTSLQAEAYRCLGIPPSRTLQIAQSLYEASLISYPRTASQKLPGKLGLPNIIAKLGRNEKYAELAQKLIDAKRFTPREGSKIDPAHPAIHPTGVIARGLEKTTERVYDLIARRFLACFAEDARRERMKVELALGEENYAASGIRTMARGWFDFYGPYVRVEEKELPAFEEKEKVKAGKPEVERKETQPPRRYTQASIIEELESRGLGTKATRSVIID